MAYPVDEIELQKLFNAFDADGSGGVTQEEVGSMARSLGILLDEPSLVAMIKEADLDGNNEIDFEEFKLFMKKMQDSAASGFGALANRKKQNGPQLQWRTDKKGPGMIVSGSTCSREAPKEAEEAWGVQLVDVRCSSAGLDTASALFECSDLESCYIGLVSSNFQGSGWNESLDMSSHAVVARADGTIFRKGIKLATANGAARLSPLKGCFLQIDLKMHEQRAVMKVLGPDNKLRASVHVEDLPVEVAVAVAFGPSEGKQSVTLVGSSTEKTKMVSRMDEYEQIVTLAPRKSALSTMQALSEVAAGLG